MHNTCNFCPVQRPYGCCNILEQIAELLFGEMRNGCGCCHNGCGTTWNNGCGTTWNNGCGTTRNNGCGWNRCETVGIPVTGRVYLQTTGGFVGNGVNTTVNGQTGHGDCGCAFATANGFLTTGYNSCGYTTYGRNTCGCCNG